VRKVAIFGGGQSGLQLALGLLQNQYEVTVVSNRMPEQILSGRVSSSQFMFHEEYGSAKAFCRCVIQPRAGRG
jgi:2-polyprenyl-6-methoxyphenol hydroxylase-like FAD-dependent oxidoreductase